MTRTNRRSTLALLVGSCLAGLAGCRSDRVALHLSPSPHRTDLKSPDGTLVGRVWIAVPGALRGAPGTAGEEPHLRLLVRVENLGREPIAIDPRGVRVIDDELREFQAPPDPAPAAVDPGRAEDFELYLRYPEGVRLLDGRPRGLDVRVPLRIGEAEYEATASLRRAVEVLRDPYDYPYWGPYYDPWYPWYPWYPYWGHVTWTHHYRR